MNNKNSYGTEVGMQSPDRILGEGLDVYLVQKGGHIPSPSTGGRIEFLTKNGEKLIHPHPTAPKICWP